MMKAAVLTKPGPPEALEIENRSVPIPQEGEVLIRVRAFGLNRSELFTRQGLSPKSSVTLPRILGIEAVGTVEYAPGSEFRKGQTVATAMGGMGRLFDGGYAEYTCVPANQVQSIETNLAWDVLGALPEMLQTAWGSLFIALQLKKDETLLVRGGTTSVGLAAAAIAKSIGARVFATTRSAANMDLLHENGADTALIDDGNIASAIAAHAPDGVDKVLELVGTTTIGDSLKCVKQGGSVCMTGMVGNKWTIENFSPMGEIPTGVNLTTYSGGVNEFMRTPLQELVKQVEAGTLKPKIGQVFKLDEIAKAHECMEQNRAGGKIVVTT